jgi:hypothetical protein
VPFVTKFASLTSLSLRYTSVVFFFFFKGRKKEIKERKEEKKMRATSVAQW